MRRGVAILFAVVLALSAVSGSRAQSTADVILHDLAGFWASEFAGSGTIYWSPEILVLGEPIETSCGVLSASFGPGAYCGADTTLYYSPIWFQGFEADSQGQVLLTVLAHEWGHHVQLLLGIPWQPDAAYELQADCLAGTYARHAEQVGLATPGSLADSVRLSAVSGDVGSLPQDAAAHGTGAERAIAFMNGYQGGAGNCGAGL